jgi:hypothetical protein
LAELRSLQKDRSARDEQAAQSTAPALCTSIAPPALGFEFSTSLSSLPHRPTQTSGDPTCSPAAA